MFPFWFLCYVNSSGQGLAVHICNNIFIAIGYSEDDLNVSTNIRSFLHEFSINEMYKLQVFFFVGESNLPFSGLDGDSYLDGMTLMAYIW